MGVSAYPGGFVPENTRLVNWGGGARLEAAGLHIRVKRLSLLLGVAGLGAVEHRDTLGGPRRLERRGQLVTREDVKGRGTVRDLLLQPILP